MEKYGIALYVVLNLKDVIYGHKLVLYEDHGTKSKEELLYDINIDNECISQRDNDLLDLIDME